jgi:hypothetical protein
MPSQHPYSPDRTPRKFYLFPQLKGRHFKYAGEIQTALTKIALQEMTHNGF